MSIRDVIQWRCDEQRLFPLVDSAPGDTAYRSLYIAQEIKDLLDTEWPTVMENKRVISLQLDLLRFVSDEFIPVARVARRARPWALLNQLEQTDEIWEIRSVDPLPSLRVFGRFAEKDVFVALRWQHRGILADFDSGEWDLLVKICQHDWRTLLTPFEPHRGRYPHDYLSRPIYDRS